MTNNGETADYDAHEGERCAEHGIPGCLRAHPAEKDAPHCATCTCGCTCGYGGFHEPENERCELYATPIPPAEGGNVD